MQVADERAVVAVEADRADPAAPLQVMAPSAEAPPAAAPEPPAAPEAPTTTRMRKRLARLGAQRSTNPVLEPLFRTVLATHPKADLRDLERAYEVAERCHRGQRRKSGD